MDFATLARCLGALLVLTACGSESHGATDGGAPQGGEPDAGPTEAVRWVKSLSGDYARLLARPDGGLVLLTTTATETRVRAFAAEGTERWSHGFDVAPFNVPYDAPAIAVGRNGETYLSMQVRSDQAAAVGADMTECAEGCSAVASFDDEGEQRWLTLLPPMQTRYLAEVDDGVVIAAIDLSTLPTLMRLSATGDIAWQQPWPFTDFWQAASQGDSFIASDGAGGFYAVSSVHNTDRSPGFRTCGVIARHSAQDGSESWRSELCGEAANSAVLFSNVVALRDGAVAVVASGLDEPTVLSFDGGAAPRFSVTLPQEARTAAFGGASFLTVATQTGPVAAIDDRGRPQWQWPGQLADGALTAHPSGLCRGSAALAPDGDLYVLTRDCAAARALLDAPPSEDDALVYDTWLLARVRVDRDGTGPRCGNGWVDPGEECDDADFIIPDDGRDGLPRPALCSAWFEGNGWIHAPLCTSACEVDVSACETTCGNGQLDEGENCDGEQFRWAQSCDEANLGSGPLGCVDCEVDLSVCPERFSCGDGVLQDWETCDSDESRGPRTCEEAGLPSSNRLNCSDDCRELDFSPCEQ